MKGLSLFSGAGIGESINMNLSSKEVRRIRRGFERFKKLDDNDKKYLMDFIAL